MVWVKILVLLGGLSAEWEHPAPWVPHQDSWQKCVLRYTSLLCPLFLAGLGLVLPLLSFCCSFEIIHTSSESRGFLEHLPSATTYHINHSPRNKLVLTGGFLSNWISPFQMLLLITLKVCWVPYVLVTTRLEESKQKYSGKQSSEASASALRLEKHHPRVSDTAAIQACIPQRGKRTSGGV